MSNSNTPVTPSKVDTGWETVESNKKSKNKSKQNGSLKSDEKMQKINKNLNHKNINTCKNSQLKSKIILVPTVEHISVPISEAVPEPSVNDSPMFLSFGDFDSIVIDESTNVSCIESASVTAPTSIPITVSPPVPITLPTSIPITVPTSIPITVPSPVPTSIPITVPVTVPVTPPVPVPVRLTTIYPCTKVLFRQFSLDTMKSIPMPVSMSGGNSSNSSSSSSSGNDIGIHSR